MKLPDRGPTWAHGWAVYQQVARSAASAQKRGTMCPYKQPAPTQTEDDPADVVVPGRLQRYAIRRQSKGIGYSPCHAGTAIDIRGLAGGSRGRLVARRSGRPSR